MLLALDTSTRLASIALYSGARGLISEYTWHSANQHTVELMPAIARMLAQAKMTPADLLAVAVALGPGSFTGLRVALAAGKGLAIARNLVLLGVPTLDVVAYPHRKAHSIRPGSREPERSPGSRDRIVYWGQPLPVIALLQAGRGRVCWASYPQGQESTLDSSRIPRTGAVSGIAGQNRVVDGLAAPTPYTLDTLVGLMDSITYPAFFAGELASADRAWLSQRMGAGSRLASPALAAGRAGYLAEIAWERFAAGERDDLATLNPIYLHDPAMTHSALSSRGEEGGKA